jgi:hypothetical protein
MPTSGRRTYRPMVFAFGQEPEAACGAMLRACRARRRKKSANRSRRRVRDSTSTTLRCGRRCSAPDWVCCGSPGRRCGVQRAVTPGSACSAARLGSEPRDGPRTWGAAPSRGSDEAYTLTSWRAGRPLPIRCWTNHSASAALASSKPRSRYASKWPPGRIVRRLGSSALPYASRARSTGVRWSFSATTISSGVGATRSMYAPGS